MSIRREVGRRLGVWLLMFLATGAFMLSAPSPPGLLERPEFPGVLLQVLLAGALMALNLFYLCARLNNEKITRMIVGCMLVALYLFPDYVWGPLGRVFNGVNPVVSALLVMTAVFFALNVVIHFEKWDARAGAGEKPS
jgi:FtsH-binding integral membrane protein